MNAQSSKIMYNLEKYKGLCSRHTCPMCGKNNSFTYYVDENNIPLNENVGRCNHESSCCYHYTPKEYFRDNPTAKKSFKPQHYLPIRQKRKPLCRIPFEYVDRAKGAQNNLIYYLRTLFDEVTIQRLIDEYYIGSTQNGEAIFWQIDTKYAVRTGKIQGYNRATGKRIKGEFDRIDWVHSRLKKRGSLPDNWELTQCLFGEHLLAKYPEKIVVVVEGEKNALFGAAKYDDFIWIATGSKQGLQVDKLKVLRGRIVIMFPDADAYDLWVEKSKLLTFCRVVVSDLTVATTSTEEQKRGFDIADYITKEMIAL